MNAGAHGGDSTGFPRVGITGSLNCGALSLCPSSAEVTVSATMPT